ncbi:MAG: Thermostable beta-glucosidase B [bacterium ADurb.Bin478]|nr:MAG: Thermostable beta-glucosidase B [bacterium ADurb.Bin478]
MVLLKNESRVLPLDLNAIRSLAVIGPNADEARMYGGGSGYLPAHYAVSPLQGIRDKVGDRISVTFVKGGRLQRLSLSAIPSGLLRPPESSLGDKGLLGEYFNNRELDGEPVLTRIDEGIDFNWETASPAPGVVAADLFSVRWSGSFVAPGSGVYELGVVSDNGCRLYLDGKLVIDSWIIDKASSLRSIYIELEKERVYPIRLEFFENVGTCEAHLGLAYYGQGNEVEQAEAAARAADVAVVCAGLNETLEGEGNDRESLALSKEQVQLIQAVAAANPKTIVVLNNGTPILMNGWADRVPAILEAFYPGQEGGRALADILFGDVNPSGKLPISFPARLEDSPVYATYPGARESVQYAEGLLVGYRFFDRKGIEPQFPFGHGLSYTSFSYAGLSIHPAKIGRQDTALIMLRVKNNGAVEGEEVVQLYVQSRRAKPDRPVKELKGFLRVPLRAGEEKTVRFKLAADELSVYDVKLKRWLTKPDSYNVLIASSSRDVRLQGSIKVYQK